MIADHSRPELLYCLAPRNDWTVRRQCDDIGREQGGDGAHVPRRDRILESSIIGVDIGCTHGLSPKQ